MAKLRIIALSMYLSLVDLIILNKLINIKLLYICRIFTGFIYLTFIIGSIILLFLNFIPDLLSVLLYSVALSIATLMILGVAIDIFSTFLTFKPLSLTNLMIVTSIPLLLTAKIKNDNFEIKIIKIIKKIFKKDDLLKILCLILIPFLSIFGAYLFNKYNIYILNLLVILVVSLIPVMVLRLPNELQPLAIYIAAFSISYNLCLTTWYIWGWDIHHLFHWTLITYMHKYWNPLGYGSLLINTIIPTIYSVITGISLIWFYKVIFPFFVTLIPLAIYSVCKKAFESNYMAALAPFSFMFYYVYYKTFPAKQLPAELFLLLIVDLILNSSINFSSLAILVLLTYGLIGTHYGVGWFLLLILTLASIFAYILSKLLIIDNKKVNEISNIYKFTFIYSIIIIGWYMFIYNGIRFSQIVRIGYDILMHLVTYFLHPPSRSAITYIEYYTPNIIWILYKCVNMFYVLILLIGFLQIIYFIIKKRKIFYKSLNFTLLLLATYVFLVSSITITYCMGFDRTLQLAITILAPCVVLGFCFLFTIVRNIIEYILKININLSKKQLIKYLAIFFIIYSLFNSGFIFKITNSPLPPYCITLSKRCWQSWRAFYLSEVCGIVWLKKYCSKMIAIPFTKVESIASEYYGHGNYTLLTWGRHFVKSVPPDTYMYFSSVVVVDRGFWFGNKFIPLNATPLYRIMISSSKIYTSGYGEAYVS